LLAIMHVCFDLGGSCVEPSPPALRRKSGPIAATALKPFRAQGIDYRQVWSALGSAVARSVTSEDAHATIPL
jgi:hypothetical protein